MVGEWRLAWLGAAFEEHAPPTRWEQKDTPLLFVSCRVSIPTRIVTTHTSMVGTIAPWAGAGASYTSARCVTGRRCWCGLVWRCLCRHETARVSDNR